MTITIDKAGRCVIPLALRRQFHLDPGTPIELIPDGDSIRLRRQLQRAELVEKDGILVQAASTVASIDATAFVNDLREMRGMENTGLPSR
jgi:AbrB family looped-hinge helix DNA binding protein